MSRALRPVLDGMRIELRTVWVSPAAPRGIWRVGGRELNAAPAGQDWSESHEVRR